MKKYYTIILFLFVTGKVFPQSYKIETSDIDRFWAAYDKLSAATSRVDSLKIIQSDYIDKASSGFKVFIRKRELTSIKYLVLLNKYPKFWKSLRPVTEKIKTRTCEIDSAFEKLKNAVPGFKCPDVYFAIGCLNTGGTTGSDLILIGAEITVPDSTVDKSEMHGWLNAVIGNGNDVVAMLAHESIHCNQRTLMFPNLLRQSLHEGGADFLTQLILNVNINKRISMYGDSHECDLWKDFAGEMYGKDVSNWMYQGDKVKNEGPADLGYFVGRKICEAYYNKEPDKKKAILEILKQGEGILQTGGYDGHCKQ